MKRFLQSLMVIAMLMTFKISYSQWTLPNAQGNINNTNTGSIILTGSLDQRSLNPSGVPLDPNGGITAQVNANFGGFIIHSAVNNSSVMNMFWGQNFDYHNNGTILYRINGPAAQQQMVNGSHYFYTAPAGASQTNITAFAFQPKFSIVNNGGVAIGTSFAMANNAGQGILTVENNIGLGTQNPTAQLHTTGTVRFEGLPQGVGNALVVDANGNLMVAQSIIYRQSENKCEEDIKLLKNEIEQLKNDIKIFKQQQFPGKIKNNYFTLSPNPFNQTTLIKYNLPNIMNNASFYVYDLQGKIIKQIKVPQGTISGTLTLTKENLSSGIYFISISTNNTELQTEKAIIAN